MAAARPANLYDAPVTELANTEPLNPGPMTTGTAEIPTHPGLGNPMHVDFAAATPALDATADQPGDVAPVVDQPDETVPAAEPATTIDLDATEADLALVDAALAHLDAEDLDAAEAAVEQIRSQPASALI